MPSTGLVPNVGEKKMLETFAGLSTPQNLVLHLFKNNITPASTMVLSDYTEATFTGYAPITLSSGNWTVSSGFPTSATYSSGVAFTCSGTTSESVYGFYLSEAVSSELMWSERFEAAKPITYIGDSLTVLPRLQLFGGITLPALKMYLTLDESSGGAGIRYDSAGKTHMTPINGPTSIAGVIGNAASFDAGSSQALKHIGYLELDGSLGITVTYRVRIRTGAPTNATFFYDGATFISAVSFDTSNVGPRYHFFTVSNDVGNSANTGTLLAAFDTWYFLAGIYDPATGTCRMHVNAAASTGNSAPIVGGHPTIDFEAAAAAAGAAPRVVVGAGNFLGSLAAFSSCDLDDLRVYNTVLSTGQIEYLYKLNRWLLLEDGTGRLMLEDNSGRLGLESS